MNVAESIQLAREWVEGYGANHPEFRGAHLMGGITSLPQSAEFPPTTDLDLAILVETASQPPQAPIEEFYRGMPIEAGLRSVELYGSPEVVLANPDLASNLAVDSIIADPYGLLAQIQPLVSAEYARPRWVMARCEVEKEQALAALGRAAQATTPAEFHVAMFWALTYLSGLITVASVRPPTHRKCLVLLRELLRAQGMDDLYEETLSIGGFAHLSATQVSTYQMHQAAAFARAVEIHRTPSPGDFKFKPHLHAYIVDGFDVMIKQGDHREAMLWVCCFLDICTRAIKNDGPAAEGARYSRILSELFDLLGVATPGSRSEKLHKAREVKDSLFALADEIVGRLVDDTPMIVATA